MLSKNLARIADYLDCSVDYLLGRTSTPEEISGHSETCQEQISESVLNAVKHKKNYSDTAEAAPEVELLAIYENLNQEGREKLLDYADDLASSGKYKKSSQSQLGKKEA